MRPRRRGRFTPMRLQDRWEWSPGMENWISQTTAEWIMRNFPGLLDEHGWWRSVSHGVRSSVPWTMDEQLIDAACICGAALDKPVPVRYTGEGERRAGRHPLLVHVAEEIAERLEERTVNDWFKDDEEREEHRQMMSDSSLWPSGVLFLKHPERVMNGDTERAYARLMDGSGLVISMMNGEVESYTSIEGILERGWVVD